MVSYKQKLISHAGNLGPRVRGRRRELGLTLARVAEESGLSVPYVSLIERGESNPTLSALQGLAAALGLSMPELFVDSSNRGADDAGQARTAEEAPEVAAATTNTGRAAVAGAPGSPVGHWMRVRREEFLEWVNTSGTERELPELIRRLVEETTIRGTRFHMPTGVGTQSGGPDGEITCDEPHPYVPQGHSVWELTIAKNANRKAENDYAKSCRALSSEERAELAYVAVNARAWMGARDFQEDKSAAGDFREVRAHNVDDLVAWLARAPETTVWLRELMGKPVVGVEPISRFWERWLASTVVPLDAGVVLAGREESAATLTRRCLAGGVLTVGGDAPREEILVFIAAALAESDQHSEALYVTDLDSASRLLAHPIEPNHAAAALTVVVDSVDVTRRLVPTAPQCVIVPIPGDRDADIDVGPLDSVKVAGRLEAHGVVHETAWALSHTGRRSLLVLRRKLALKPELHRPRWGQNADRVLRRCLLLNRWDRSNPGDIETVTRFVGQPYDYEDLEERLERLVGDDPPLMRMGSLWYAVSPADAWLVAGGRLQHDDLEDFADVAVEVLGEPDPLLGMGKEERFQAAYEGLGSRHSERLKEGLAATSAVLATTGTPVPAQARHFVDGAVSRMLSSANSDPMLYRWGAIAAWLPVLAEAAPEAVLRAVRAGLTQHAERFAVVLAHEEHDEDGLLRDLLKQNFGAALDVLAWTPEHLGSAADLLAKLASLDSGGGLSKEPIRTLHDIFCPWKPNTSASAEERFAVLDELRHNHPPIAWQVMLSMLPSTHQSKSDGFTPTYRDWKDHRKAVTYGEHNEVVARVSSILISDVALDPQRYRSLIARCGNMPPQSRVELRLHLHHIAASGDEAARQSIWPALRELVARHREFSDTHWALSPEETAEFESLLPMLQPESFAKLYGHLFESSVTFVEGVSARHDGYDAHEEAIKAHRVSAVTEIVRVGGVEAVELFARSVEVPGLVGAALADAAGGGNTDAQVLMRLDASEAAVAAAARGYFITRFRTSGWGPLDVLLADTEVSPAVAAELLRASDDPAGAWERVDAADAEVRDEYWSRFTRWDLRLGDTLVPEAIRRLNRAGRPSESASLLAWSEFHHRDNPEFAHAAAETLEQLTDGSGSTQLGDDTIESLLAVLHQHADTLGEPRVRQIEWACLPELVWGAKTPCLHKAMAEDPDYFAQVAETAYGRTAGEANSDEGGDVGEHQARVSGAAYGLLREWGRSPGLDTDGNIDATLLGEWTSKARARLAEVGHAQQGDIAIGAALAASPAAADGQWPAPEVCDLIETIASDEIDLGFSMAVSNSRGVVSGSIWEGGRQDRELADKHRQLSQQLKPKWHRTAEIFSRLADQCDYMALHDDARVEARHLGLRP